jgi:hypothetical protein
MSATNPLWGAPRIHGELLKLGLDANRGGRFLRRADGNVPTLVRAADPRA